MKSAVSILAPYRRELFCLLVAFLLLAVAEPCLSEDNSAFSSAARVVKSDFRNFYLDGNNLVWLGAGVAGAAIIANTSLDRDIDDAFERNAKGSTSDDISCVAREVGVPWYTIPVLAGASLLFPDTAVGNWAQRSVRAIVVGAPTLLVLQVAIGGERPERGDPGWRPLHSSDGVSDHAFIGSVPFLVAAEMNDNLIAKTGLYALSLLPALSRINDGKHYFSQAALGWYLGWLSTRAVAKTESKKKLSFILMPLPDGGLTVTASGQW